MGQYSLRSLEPVAPPPSENPAPTEATREAAPIPSPRQPIVSTTPINGPAPAPAPNPKAIFLAKRSQFTKAAVGTLIFGSASVAVGAILLNRSHNLDQRQLMNLEKADRLSRGGTAALGLGVVTLLASTAMVGLAIYSHRKAQRVAFQWDGMALRF